MPPRIRRCPAVAPIAPARSLPRISLSATNLYTDVRSSSVVNRNLFMFIHSDATSSPPLTTLPSAGNSTPRVFPLAITLNERLAMPVTNENTATENLVAADNDDDDDGEEDIDWIALPAATAFPAGGPTIMVAGIPQPFPFSGKVKTEADVKDISGCSQETVDRLKECAKGLVGDGPRAIIDGSVCFRDENDQLKGLAYVEMARRVPEAKNSMEHWMLKFFLLRAMKNFRDAATRKGKGKAKVVRFEDGHVEVTDDPDVSVARVTRRSARRS